MDDKNNDNCDDYITAMHHTYHTRQKLQQTPKTYESY